MKHGLSFCSGFFRPPLLLGVGLLGALVVGAFLLANYSGAATGRTEAIPEAVDSEADEERQPALDPAEEIAAAKFRLELAEQAAAAQADPNAPDGTPPFNDTCGGAEVIPTTLPALSSVYDINVAGTAGDPPLPGSP